MYKIDDFAMMTPMKYYNNEVASQKRNDMINDKNLEYIATEKHDGDWSMCIHYSKGNNLIRSRSISKITGAYGDYTAKLPHLCAEMDNWPDGTVVLAELCFKTYSNCNGVGTILRCLPAKAIERQKDNPLYGFVFDILMINGHDITEVPYEERICDWAELVTGLVPNTTAQYFKRTAIFYNGIDFAEAADEIIAAGGEGVVIQRKDNPYMPGTRTAWKTLKLKQSLPSAEYKVVGTLEPNRVYDGDFASTWEYRELVNMESGHAIEKTLLSKQGELMHYMQSVPVTKPYFMGWKNGITILLPNGITTDVTSGLTDADREWLATDEAKAKIAAGELWAEVKAMSVNDKGALRHGSLVRLRITEDGVND